MTITNFHKISLVFGLFLIFTLVFRLENLNHKKSNYINGQQVSFYTILTQEPKILGQNQNFTVTDPKGERILVRTSLYPQFHYGQKLLISGTISIPEQKGVSSENTLLLSKKKLAVAIYFPKIEAADSNSSIDGNFALAAVGSIRQKLVKLFQTSLKSPYDNLMLGIVFGIQLPMPKDFMTSLRNAGVLHVIAASGMNVTIVSGFIASLFGFFFKRQVALTLSIAAIVFYAALAGFEASIVRATVMGAILFIAQIFGRQSLALFNLGIAGYLMLLISPELLYDVGFQLSFTSTLGLILLKSVIDRYISFLSLFGDDISTTICAQIATLPIILANFGTYSLWSVAANGLVLWMIPFLMIIGACASITGFLFAGLGTLLLYISLPFLWLFKAVVDFFGSFPPMTISAVSVSFILGYYLLITSLVLFSLQRKHA